MSTCGAWKSLSLTAVNYESGNLLSLALGLVSLSPVFLVAQLTALVAVQRDWQTLVLLAGVLLNVCLNKVLKDFFREPRPASRCVFAMGVDGGMEAGGFEEYGMPSNHSQFMAFIAAYMSLFLIGGCKGMPLPERALLSAVALLAAGLVAYSRCYLGYHSVAQVLVGLVVGSSAGFAWYTLYVRRLHVLGSWVAETWWARALRLEAPPRIDRIAALDRTAGDHIRCSAANVAEVTLNQGWVVSEASASLLQARCERQQPGWGTLKSKRVLSEYERFLTLKVQCRDFDDQLLLPCPLVATVWHLHVLDTKQYALDCAAICGRLINHDPDIDVDQQAQRLRRQRTALKYAQHYGCQPPGGIWGDGSGG